MTPLGPGSIFRSSLMLALGAATALAIAIITVIFSAPPPFDFPVSTLDIARALRGDTVAEQTAPLNVRTSLKPPLSKQNSGVVDQIIREAVVRQTGHRDPDIVMALDNSMAVGPDPFGVARNSYERQLSNSARLYKNDPGFSPLVFGAFEAAIRLPDGRWRIVSRAPSAMLWQYRLASSVIISLLLIVPIAWFFSKRLALPIRAFGEAANRIGQGNFEEIDVRGPIEIRQASHALNLMQRRIERFVSERTTMIGAIAHDLRTPLSRLAFLTENGSPEMRAKVKIELDEMDRMISGTMDFVRNDAMPLHFEKVDLRLLIEVIVDDNVDTGKDVFVEPGLPLTLHGDASMLRRIFSNLVSNAVSYGGNAKIAMNSTPAWAIIEVRDDGPGLSQENIERAFEPFFRAEPSRNRKTGGAGLGLAIAKSGVEAHGGTIVLGNSAEGGLSVTVRLPMHQLFQSSQPPYHPKLNPIISDE
jgi:two-component system, OmpR family, sensor kinase